jgi:hypothetical protein
VGWAFYANTTPLRESAGGQVVSDADDNGPDELDHAIAVIDLTDGMFGRTYSRLIGQPLPVTNERRTT